MSVRFDRRAAVAAAAFFFAAVVWRLAASSGTQSNTPRPVLAGSTTRLTDDFSSRAGWATFSSETAGLSYVEGGYRLRLDRPRDDGLSVLLLPGRGWRSVAASTAVEERAPMGGLVGVGCAAGEEEAYLGAVDPAGTGFVILRVGGSGAAVLRYGAGDEAQIFQVDEENQIQLQCTMRGGPAPHTSIRLFANGRLLAAYEDAGGLGPFMGMALGGVSLRHPLEVVFKRAALQTLPSRQDSAIVAACDRLVAADSLEKDYGWLVDSGGTRVDTPDFDGRQVMRVARELALLSADLQTAARTPGAQAGARRSLVNLADRLRTQGKALNAGTSSLDPGPIDTTGAYNELSCGAPKPYTPPDLASKRLTGVPARSRPAQTFGLARGLDRRLAWELPTPEFVSDETLPVRADLGVDVDLSYRSFRVFGATLAALQRSLQVHAIHVEGELAAGVTDSHFEWTYQTMDRAGSCTIVPGVTLALSITLPDWRPPVGASRYLLNQWNQFMWDLDEHERHHATLWIRAANRMIVAIDDAPPQSSCQNVVAAGKATVARVFTTFEGKQRAFDRDVAAGKLPAPSLP
jgi:predicted secreted Zn-dependent protease